MLLTNVADTQHIYPVALPHSHHSAYLQEWSPLVLQEVRLPVTGECVCTSVIFASAMVTTLLFALLHVMPLPHTTTYNSVRSVWTLPLLE